MGSGVPPVEAETPSDQSVTAVVEPAKNAFAEEHNPPPAPKSVYQDASLFKQAEVAHESAEQKENSEHTEVAQVKENVPTQIPVAGAEQPASIVAEKVREEVVQENAKEVQLPQEEAAPSPSDSSSSVQTAEKEGEAHTEQAPPAQANAAEQPPVRNVRRPKADGLDDGDEGLFDPRVDPAAGAQIPLDPDAEAAAVERARHEQEHPAA